jgi:hypothetical protein
MGDWYPFSRIVQLTESAGGALGAWTDDAHIPLLRCVGEASPAAVHGRSAQQRAGG